MQEPVADINRETVSYPDIAASSGRPSVDLYAASHADFLGNTAPPNQSGQLQEQVQTLSLPFFFSHHRRAAAVECR